MTQRKKHKLEEVLISKRDTFKNIFPFDINSETTFHLDLSTQNNDLKDIDITNNEVFESWLFNKRLSEDQRIPLGGYDERRILYSKSDYFKTAGDIRDIHLGIDIWVDSGTPIMAPIDSIVHSFAINTNYRDYGPTIILEHKLGDTRFYTLYGHLSIESLDTLFIGKGVKAGDYFATIGNSDVNGSWPSHLHFQLISDMANYHGDFPGVCSEKERSRYLEICPDPDLILGSGIKLNF